MVENPKSKLLDRGTLKGFCIGVFLVILVMVLGDVIQQARQERAMAQWEVSIWCYFYTDKTDDECDVWAAKMMTAHGREVMVCRRDHPEINDRMDCISAAAETW